MTAPRRSPNWIMPTAPRGTSDSRGATTAFVTQGGSGPRIVLATTSLFWFANNGSDTTGTGTQTNPWASTAPLLSFYDFGGQNVTLEAVTSHNSFTSTVAVTPWVGAGSLTVDFNSGSAAVSAANTHGFTVTGACPGQVTVQNGTVTASGANGCGVHISGATQVNDINMTYGTSTLAHVLANNGGFINLSGTRTITGDANRHIHISAAAASVLSSPTSNTVVVSGTRTFAFFVVALTSLGDFGNTTFNTSAGSLVGPQFLNTLSLLNQISTVPATTTGNSNTAGVNS